MSILEANLISIRSIAKPEHLVGIMVPYNSTYLFVKHDHDIIAYLASNPGLIQCNIREQPKIDGSYYKISSQAVSFVLKLMAKFEVTALQRFIRYTWLPSLEPLRQEKRTAVAMCLHARLGQGSALASLGQDLIGHIISHLSNVSDDRIRRGRQLLPEILPKTTMKN